MNPQLIMDPQTASPLARVPLEVLLRITYLISTPDMCSLRSTCRLMERSVFNFFQEFFRKKQFFLSEESLQALVDISLHPTLSPYLTHVIIATDRFSGDNYNKDREQATIEYMEWADQFHLLHQGRARDLLAEAFRNLPNLETIDIRDFNARRHRDEGFWSSYSSPKIARLIGQRLQIRNHNADDYYSVVFSIIVAAIGSANVRPPNLEVLFRSRPHGLEDKAFRIPTWLEPSVGEYLVNLDKLHLSVDLRGKGQASFNVGTTGVFHLKRFLFAAPNVTWLRLNFQLTGPFDNRLARIGEFLQWLYQAAPDSPTPISPKDSAPPIALAKLERLDLGFTQMELDVLERIVAKFPTLRKLHVRSIVLTNDSDAHRPPPKDDDEDEDEGRPNPWARFLKALPSVAKLVELGIASPQQMLMPTRMTVPVELGSGEDGRALSEVCLQSSIEMDRLIEALAKVTGYRWPEEQERQSSDHDSDDEDEDEDMEDDEDNAEAGSDVA